MPNAKIFVNENLTNSNHQLTFNCRKLKTEKLIWKTYSSNGIIHIVQIHGNKPIKVFHQSKLDELFPDFNFDGGGEAPKVAHESVLPFALKICEGMCCVLLLFLLFVFVAFLMIDFSVGQIPAGWLRRNIT